MRSLCLLPQANVIAIRIQVSKEPARADQQNDSGDKQYFHWHPGTQRVAVQINTFSQTTAFR
jgi:hypothetical protein